MTRMIGDAKLQADDGGDPRAGPEIAAKAIGGGTSVQEGGQPGEPLGREPAWGPRWGPVAEGFQPSCPGTLHPLADSGCADPQRFGDLALGPALLLEVPGLQPSSFLPVGW
jgi:hypothetical protein